MALAAGIDLNGAETRRKIDRIFDRQATDHLIGRIVRCSIVVAFIWVIIAASVLLFHYTTAWGWLEPESLDRLRDLLLTGGIGAGLGQLVKSHMRPDEN